MELREALKVGEIAKKVQEREAELVRAYKMRREDHYLGRRWWKRKYN